MSVSVNNGEKVYTLLVEYNLSNGLPTGRVKPNLPSDPDYIASLIDYEVCPLPEPYVPETEDVIVEIAEDYEVTIKLQFSTSHIDTSAAGTWNIVKRIYDSVVFEVVAPNSTSQYTAKIEYGSGQFKQVESVGDNNLFLRGPFEDITKISISSNVGDYNADYNPDYNI